MNEDDDDNNDAGDGDGWPMVMVPTSALPRRARAGPAEAVWRVLLQDVPRALGRPFFGQSEEVPWRDMWLFGLSMEIFEFEFCFQIRGTLVLKYKWI